MSSDRPVPGSVGWFDLTVADAESLKSFYENVVGWKAAPVEMDAYSDFTMSDASGSCVAGICHARGENAGLPAQWLLYVTVTDLEQRLEQCISLGGDVLHGPRSLGNARFAVIRDPAGAVVGLYEPEHAE